MKNYIVSNLVMENAFIENIMKGSKKRAEAYSESSFGDVRVCRLNIKDEQDEKYYNCKRGVHITVYTPELWRIDENETDVISRIIAEEIKHMISVSVGIKKLCGRRILVIGMGNRQITPDSIGALTAERVNATRHIELLDKDTFERSGICSVSAVSCGVMGETGVRTLELIRGVAKEICPDVIIAVDALAAKECSRLAATVQISDGGIAPGAGIGNRQAAINKDTVGVPVIAMGVPTVVSAATLVGEAMRRCGSTELSHVHKKILDEGKNFFVAPKECDLIADSVSRLLSLSLDKAFGVI